MVLESIINPLKAEKEPWELFFVGMFYCFFAILLSLWIFEQHASLVMVFFTAMASIPLMYNTIKLEEKKDLEIRQEKILLKEHGRALSFFVFLFLGITFAVTIVFVVLPLLSAAFPSIFPSSLHQSLFNIQTSTISQINNQVTGNAIVEFSLFTKILLNNIKVMVFCILFAFIYGAGAIFILTWNASVIGVAIGNFIRTNVASNISYFQIAPFALLRYLVHGIPEILAYFTAGLAGGIISIAVIQHDFGSEKFEHILLDSTDLMLLSVVILIVAALIEVFISPILF